MAVHGATAVAHAVAVGMRLAVEGDGLVQRVQRSGRAERVDSYEGVPGSNAATARTLGLTSGVGAPIVTEGRVWGAVTVLGSGPSLPGSAEGRLGMFAKLVATAISNAQARTDLAELADEQTALRRVAELVARGVAQEELFGTVAVEASKLVGDEATTLVRIGDDRTYTVVAVCGGPAPVGTRIDVAPDDEGVVAEILRTRRPARLDDYGARSGPAYARDDYGVGSSVGVPIVVDDCVWGVLGATTTGRRLPATAERRLGQFAELVAAALANAQARDVVEKLAQEQAALRRVAELVARGAPLDEVFAAVAGEASALLGDQAAALLRYDPDEFGTVVAAHNSPATPGLRVPSDGDTATGRIRRTGRPFRVDSFEGTSLAGMARTLGVRAAVTVPILVEGRVWGSLSTSSAGSPPPANTEERLAQLAELAAAAIANAENKAQLTASRARVVATADETRRRLQRDVHDAAQQRLVHTIITLKLARDAIAAGHPPDELVHEALTHAERANAELRDVVHGILPAALARGGLRTGLESLAADLAVPVDVRVSAPRLPSRVEITAYFIVAEALTNVVKHAHATRVTVDVSVDGDTISIVVRDDGTGGADPANGTGLTGLSDRVHANAGTLTISSPPGRGTTVHAVLALAPPATATG